MVYESDSNMLKMVDRACKILDYLKEQDQPASISVLSKDLDLPKANVFRILYTLQHNGLIEKTLETDLYKLGSKFIQYGEKVKQDFSLVDACKPHMSKLAKQIGESVNLGIVYDKHILTIHSEEGERSSLVSKLVPVAEPYCSSMGKLYLSQLPDDVLKNYYTSQLETRTVNTITNYNVFKKQQTDILENNIAFDHEEYEYGLSCIAVPLHKTTGELVAMISISGPTTRLQFKGFDDIADKLKHLAYTIEKDSSTLLNIIESIHNK